MVCSLLWSTEERAHAAHQARLSLSGASTLLPWPCFRLASKAVRCVAGSATSLRPDCWEAAARPCCSTSSRQPPGMSSQLRCDHANSSPNGPWHAGAETLPPLAESLATLYRAPCMQDPVQGFERAPVVLTHTPPFLVCATAIVRLLKTCFKDYHASVWLGSFSSCYAVEPADSL